MLLEMGKSFTFISPRLPFNKKFALSVCHRGMERVSWVPNCQTAAGTIPILSPKTQIVDVNQLGLSIIVVVNSVIYIL